MMPTITRKNLANVRILLVDCAPANVELVRLALSQVAEIPFEVCCAGDLAGALSYLRLETFDLALLNLKLPDCLGPKSLQLLRQRCRNIPIVVLTAIPADTPALKPVELGPQDFVVTGDVSAKALINSIRFAIQRQQFIAAAIQYLIELEAVGLLTSTVETVGDIANCQLPQEANSKRIDALARIKASAEQSNLEHYHSASIAMGDAKEQLRMVVNAFLLLDERCRDQLSAEGIQFCFVPLMAENVR